MIEIPQIKSIKRNVIRDDIIPYLTDLFKILFKLLVINKNNDNTA